MAASTVEAQPQKTCSELRHRVVQHRPDDKRTFVLSTNILATAQVSGGNEMLEYFRCESRRITPVVYFVPGQLFHDEPVVRLVFVERLHHVVTVAPFSFGEPNRRAIVIIEADRVRVANDVKPVAAPAHPELWGI